MREREGYKKLRIYQKAHKLAVKVHKMTLHLPKFELYEEGSQIRRSSKSVSSNIVEGYSLRRYKNEYLRYLSQSCVSSQETIEHLDYLYETNSLKEKNLYEELNKAYNELCGMLFNFTQSVWEKHETKLFRNKIND